MAHFLRATRSKRNLPNGCDDGKNVPAAVRKLSSEIGWNFRASSVKKQCVESPSPVKAPPVKVSKPNDQPTNEETESIDEDVVDAIRFIGEASPLQSMVTEAALCRYCKKGNLILTFDTVGLATSIHSKCDNCDTHCSTSVRKTSLPPGLNPQRTDYAVNCLYILSNLLSGDGGTEASRTLAFLDLPRSHSMEKTIFPAIEAELSSFILSYTKELLEENLFKEVWLSKDDPENANFDYDHWKKCVKEGKTLTFDEMPRIKVSYDMGWQKRSNGKRCDSHSGHASPVGCKTRKPLSLRVLSNFCRTCLKRSAGLVDKDGTDIITWERNNDKTPVTDDSDDDDESDIEEEETDHDCSLNFTGSSSGAMEPTALVEMTHELLDRFAVLFDAVVCDDDTTIRSQMKWSNADLMMHEQTTKVPKVLNSKGNKVTRTSGLLRYPYPPPKMPGDPAHRKKTLGSRIYGYANKPKAQSRGINKVDAMKLKRNYGHMIRQIASEPKHKWVNHGKSVLEHHFEVHLFCGEWCPRRKMKPEELEADAKKGKYYRNKEREPDVYLALKEIVDEFTTMEMLEDIGHGFNTQVNESMNNTISWFAPKNKTYSGSLSLTTRIHLAVGILLVGCDKYVSELLKRLGIEMTDGLQKHLADVDARRQKAYASKRKTEYRVARRLKDEKKMKEHIQDAEKARRKEGYYKAGEGFNTCLPVTTNDHCTACGGKDHKTTNSRKCPRNPEKLMELAKIEYEKRQKKAIN